MLLRHFGKVAKKFPGGPKGTFWSSQAIVEPILDRFGCLLLPYRAILKPFENQFGPYVGQSWAILGCLGHLRPSWAVLGLYRSHLGAILGPSWGYLGTILRPSGGHLEAIWGPSRVLWGVLATLLKPSCGHLFGKRSLRKKCFSSRRGADFCYARSASWPSFEPPLRPFWN